MIVAGIDTIEHQAPPTPRFRLAVEFLRRKDLPDLPDGEVPLDGRNVYAIIQGYETVKAGVPKFECHRRYIDVQFILSGEEIVGWAPSDEMTPAGSYDEGKDICFGTVAAGKWTPVLLRTGQLAVLWPEDAHAPRLAAGARVPVRKIVVKIAV